MKIFLIASLMLSLLGCKEEPTTPAPVDPVVVGKKECVLPFGGMLAHGASVFTYKSDKAVVCEREERLCNDGVLSGSFLAKECAVEVVETEPTTHEKPMKIDDKDLKVGGIKLLGKKSLYLGVEINQMPHPRPKLEDIATCAAGVQPGSECVDPQSLCKIASKVYRCDVKESYKVFGWVYEVIGRDFAPVEGVKADIYYFDSGSGAGGLMVGPVKTDKFGYFELLTPMLLNTVRLDGSGVGLYVFCDANGNPEKGGGGTPIRAEMVGKPFSAAFADQKRIKPDSCK